jgi:hypothetical protein
MNRYRDSRRFTSTQAGRLRLEVATRQAGYRWSTAAERW